jgi:hypothetical protein
MTVTDHSPRRWEEASPGNVTGEARALTAIGPLRQRSLGYWKLLAGFLLRRYFWLFRNAKIRPLKQLGFIHYARWVLIHELPDGDERVPLEPVYMLFESNFNGGFDEYIDAFSYVIPGAMEDIFGSAYNFPGPIPATPFKDFIRRHDYEADHFFSAYPEATAADVAAALELSEAMDKLQKRDDGNPWTFAVHWRGFMTKAQAWL